MPDQDRRVICAGSGEVAGRRRRRMEGGGGGVGEGWGWMVGLKEAVMLHSEARGAGARIGV